MQKTIFIIITRSFLTRNILRSGTLDLLKKQGHKIIIFFQSDHIPEYIKKEFAREQVKLLPVNFRMGRWHRLFTRNFSAYLLLTKSTRRRALFFNKNSKERFISKEFLIKTKIFPFVRLMALHITSRVWLLKVLYRFISLKVFPQKNKNVQNYFNSYKPDLVFSTSNSSHIDIAFMKEAKRRNIPTISMPKSWDVMPLVYFQFISDYLLVPNKISRDFAIKQQNIPKNSIYTVGLPQFDWYTKKDIIRDKKDYFAGKGLNPAAHLIFLALQG